MWNNGRGIPVEMHSVEKKYVPELIFGTLLTSSNYNDSQKKVTGGRNGYGAKLCNIFSSEFTVETSCSESKKYFKMVCYTVQFPLIWPPKLWSLHILSLYSILVFYLYILSVYSILVFYPCILFYPHAFYPPVFYLSLYSILYSILVFYPVFYPCILSL